jgi:hypothetical protein
MKVEIDSQNLLTLQILAAVLQTGLGDSLRERALRLPLAPPDPLSL